MLNIRSSRSILGTPLYLIVAPILLLGRIRLRGRIPLVKYDSDAVTAEWVTKELCFDCDRYTDHIYVEFRDEPVVESECSRCGLVRVHPDGVV